MGVSILLVSSVFLIKGGAGVLFHYIGYNESTPVYTDAPFLDNKQHGNRLILIPDPKAEESELRGVRKECKYWHN